MTVLVMLVFAVAMAQAILGLRVAVRLARTARGTRIHRAAAAPGTTVTILVPVLNERARLSSCLAGAIAQGPEVVEIIVVDGGSHDGTDDLARAFAARDPRVRLLDASPIPGGWTGKAWGLSSGLDAVTGDPTWVLCLDADVRPKPALTASLVAHAADAGVAALSAATRQRLSSAGEGLVHPALLTTLVYRFGIPGHATNDVARVQANGQCFLARRDVLLRTGAFRAARSSLCEDVTIARAIAAAGEPVGFYETDDLVAVEMYRGLRDAWHNWPRSLPMRDRYFGWHGALGLAEVALVQALPLPALVVALAMDAPMTVVIIEAALLAIRAGTLAGVARAYAARPWTYWLSPLADAAAAFALVRSSLRHRHVWRGRTYVQLARGEFQAEARHARARNEAPSGGAGGAHRMMRVAYAFLAMHALAVLFALGGLLVALPHPELWADSAAGTWMFGFGMSFAASIHIVLGAAAVFAFGAAVLGWRRVVIFFVVSVTLSLGVELLGTGTGWPFGAYEYAYGLGWKVLDRVPFSIPLSWFSLGLTSYLLAHVVVDVLGVDRRPWRVIALGAWFLTVWDLVLDPAMAHPALPIRFWIWHQTGPYFGMPVQNFVAWAANGAMFMALSRALWGRDIDPHQVPAGFPFAIYGLNMLFAAVLAASVGLWQPVVLAAVLGLGPAALVYGRQRVRQALHSFAAT